MKTATAFAPGSIGNVGPGFDVLGLAIEALGDRVSVELTDGDARIDSITGVDAALVPLDPQRNAASIAAIAWLRAHGDPRNPIMTIEKGLPLCGGLGGSAASSVAGAFAAAMAMGSETSPIELAGAALAGEMAVAGAHLDNIAASILGGLALSRSVRPIDIVALTLNAGWRLALVTPDLRIATKEARDMLPQTSARAVWVQQMANTAGVVHAFATGDGELLRRALDDRYSEPPRAALIPHFIAVKRAAIDAGAFACTISGSGPTLVAFCEDDDLAKHVAASMQNAFGQVRSTSHVSAIARQGVRAE
jgi:homoserine kinase